MDWDLGESEIGLQAAVRKGIATEEEAAALREEGRRLGRSPLELLRERKRLSEETLSSLKMLAAKHVAGAFPEPDQTVTLDKVPTPEVPPAMGPPGGADPDSTLTLEQAPVAPVPVRNPAAPVFPVSGWDRYQCVRFLGQGGMGQVFLAHDPVLRRDVALKFIRGDDARLSHRFISEARAQARVNDERVCKVYEVGDVQGKRYIAMQYVDGKPLEALTRELTVEQKVLVLRAAAEGVNEAHRAGLIHRDLKPSNIMVERTADGVLRTYVMDFGLARDWSQALTATGAVLGTPYYMAPEQARGEVSTLDRRADVYSLGATLYNVLTGRPPIPGSNGLEVLSNIATLEPIPPRQLDPNIPPDLEAITLKCLEKDRTARYPSARALAEDLERFLAGDPVRARASGLGYRLRKRVLKHRAIASVAAAALVAVVLALGWAGLQRREVLLRERLARRFTEQVGRVESLSRYSSLAPPHDTRADHEVIQAHMDALAEEIRQGGERALGPGHYALGRGYLALDDMAKAHHFLESAWHHGFHEPQAAYALAVVMGRLYREHLLEAERLRDPGLREARRRDAQRRFRDPARVYLRQSGGSEAPSADYLAALLAFYEDRFDEALAHLESVDTVRQPWFYEATQLQGDLLVARATRRWNTADREGALADFEAGRQAYAKAAAIGRSVPAIPYALGELEYAALVMEIYGQGDVLPHAERGLEAASRALALAPSHLGATLLQARLHRRLAEYRIDRGEDAKEQLEKATGAARHAEALAPGEPQALLELGLGLWQWGRSRQDLNLDPRDQFQLAEAAFERIGPEHRDYDFHLHLGLVFKVWADYEDQMGADSLPKRDKGIARFHEALELEPQLPHAWLNLGDSYLRRASQPRNPRPEDDLGQAAAAFDKAQALNPRHFVPYYFRGQVHEQLAKRLRLFGKDARPELVLAVEQYRQGLEINPNVPQLHTALGTALLAQAEAAWDHGADAFPLLEQARTAYVRATEVAPQQGFAFHNLSEVLARRASYQAARGEDPSPSIREGKAALREALARIPGYADPWSNLGMLYSLQATFEFEQGRDPRSSLSQASEALRQALARSPRHVQSVLYVAETQGVRARWLARLGRATAVDFEEAAKSYQQALALAPERQGIRIAFAGFCREWGRWQQQSGRDSTATWVRGLTLAEEMLTARPTWAEARLLRASVLLARAQGASTAEEQRRWGRQALEDLTRGLDANPNLKRGWRAQLQLARRLTASPEAP
jgi:serine/threonine-protein kinase